MNQKSAVKAPVVTSSSVSAPATKAEVIARLIANADLDFGCCGHAKPAAK